LDPEEEAQLAERERQARQDELDRQDTMRRQRENGRWGQNRDIGDFERRRKAQEAAVRKDVSSTEGMEVTIDVKVQYHPLDANNLLGQEQIYKMEEIDPESTVYHILTLLATNHDISTPHFLMDISFNGRPMHFAETLRYYGIGNNDTILIIERAEGERRQNAPSPVREGTTEKENDTFELVVRYFRLDDNTFLNHGHLFNLLGVARHARVGHIPELLAENYNILSPHRIIISFKGRPLDWLHSLHDCGIQQDRNEIVIREVADDEQGPPVREGDDINRPLPGPGDVIQTQPQGQRGNQAAEAIVIDTSSSSLLPSQIPVAPYHRAAFRDQRDRDAQADGPGLQAGLRAAAGIASRTRARVREDAAGVASRTRARTRNDAAQGERERNGPAAGNARSRVRDLARRRAGLSWGKKAGGRGIRKGLELLFLYFFTRFHVCKDV
jgi:hypothetical protein